MRRHAPLLLALLFFGYVNGSCTHASKPQDSHIRTLLDPRMGRHAQWVNESQTALIEKSVSYLLQDEISLEHALRISLLCNRSLQAIYQDLGIACADVIQAGLLPNPLFNASLGFTHSSSSSTSYQFSILQNFIDIFLMPLRKKHAAYMLEQVELQVAQAILDHVFQVKNAYYALQAKMETSRLLADLIETEDAKSLLLDRQYASGNIDLTMPVMQKKHVCKARMALAQSKSDIGVMREKFSVLLGLPATCRAWSIQQFLPHMPDQEAALSHLRQKALAERLDIQAAKLEVKKKACDLGLNKWWAKTDGQIGIIQQKDSEGITSLGPSFQLALPLFDCGQALKAKQKASLKQSFEQWMVKRLQVEAEVQAAIDMLLASRSLAEQYLYVLTPLQKKSMELTQTMYDAMAASPYALLDEKKASITLQIECVEALRNYWMLRTQLEKAVGSMEAKT